MEDQSVIHSTFVIQRNYLNSPQQVFSAFSDASRKRRWFAEDESHDVREFKMDFRVGGGERVRFCLKEGSPFQGVEVINEGSYQDIVPNRRIVTASSMTFRGKRMSVSLVTIELLAAGNGTDLICTNQSAFFEGADGSQRREAGWLDLFEQLAKELERK